MRSLVLNASFEPLCVVPLKRAVILVLAEKAEIVEEREGSIRSERLTMPIPSVIKLTKYVRIPYRRRIPLSRRAVLARDNYTCGYCGKEAETMDHIVPTSKGGLHIWSNVVASCKRCNYTKANKSLKDTGMTLRTHPGEPAGIVALVVVFGRLDENWEPYLVAA